MSNGMVKMEAFLKLETESAGGRRTPIPNGFKTDLKYDDSDYRIVAIEFDKEMLFPGEATSVVCHVLLHSEDEVDYLLGHGRTIIADGPNIIGEIQIKSVIDREKIKWSD